MNGVRGPGIAGIGDREALIGPNLRQEEMGEGDRFRSVLSRIAGAVSNGVASLDAEEGVASGPASGAPDSRLRMPEAGDDIPDDDLATGTASTLHIAERPVVRLLPHRLDANRERPLPASEPAAHRQVLTVPPTINARMATPAAVLLDPPAAPAIAAIGPPDLLLPVPEAAGDEHGEPSGAGEPLRFAAVGGVLPAGMDTAPSANADEPSGWRTESMLPEGGDADGKAELGWRTQSPELPHVTVISRERHFAPAERPAPPRPAIPPSDPPPDRPVSPPDGLTVGPDERPRDDRLAQTDDLLKAAIEPRAKPHSESVPQNQETGTPRQSPAGIVPARAAAAISPTEGPPEPPADAVAADRGFSQRTAPLPEASRATVIPQERPFVPARRLDPAKPAASAPQLDPQRSPVTGLAPTGTEATARSVHPAPPKPPSSPIVPESTPQSPQLQERGGRDLQPGGAVLPAASATVSSMESTFNPVNGVLAPGQDVLQRISGAVVEAAGSAALSAPANNPVVTAGTDDHAPASAPTRALTIRVDLPEHGAVHVRLALNGNALSLRVRADREQVAEQLRQEHLKLTDTLSAAGYDTEIVAIEGRRNEITPPPGIDAASRVETGADGAANADRGSGGENQRSAARHTQEPDRGFGEDFLPHDQEDHETRNIAQRRADALYV